MYYVGTCKRNPLKVLNRLTYSVGYRMFTPPTPAPPPPAPSDNGEFYVPVQSYYEFLYNGG